MNKWNGIVKCVSNCNDIKYLCKDKIYNVHNGKFLYDDGVLSMQYKNLSDLNYKSIKIFIELYKEEINE